MQAIDEEMSDTDVSEDEEESESDDDRENNKVVRFAPTTGNPKFKKGRRRLFKRKARIQAVDEAVTLESEEMEFDAEGDASFATVLAFKNSMSAQLEPKCAPDVDQLVQTVNLWSFRGVDPRSAGVAGKPQGSGPFAGISSAAYTVPQLQTGHPAQSQSKWAPVLPQPYRNSTAQSITPRKHMGGAYMAVPHVDAAIPLCNQGLALPAPITLEYVYAMALAAEADLKLTNERVTENMQLSDNIVATALYTSDMQIKVEQVNARWAAEKVKILKKERKRLQRLQPKDVKLASGLSLGTRGAAPSQKKFQQIRPGTSLTAQVEILRANAKDVFITATKYKKATPPGHSLVAKMIQAFAKDHLEDLGESAEWKTFAGVRHDHRNKAWANQQIYARLRPGQCSDAKLDADGILSKMTATYNLAVADV